MRYNREDTMSVICPVCRKLTTTGDEAMPLPQLPANVLAEFDSHGRRLSRVYHFVQPYLKRLMSPCDFSGECLEIPRYEARTRVRERRKGEEAILSKRYVIETLRTMNRVEVWLDRRGEFDRLLNVRLPRVIDYEATVKLCGNEVFVEVLVLKDESRFVFFENGWLHRAYTSPPRNKATCHTSSR
jgi:hypothetical protein